jgi:hypothetical protein
VIFAIEPFFDLTGIIGHEVSNESLSEKKIYIGGGKMDINNAKMILDKWSEFVSVSNAFEIYVVEDGKLEVVFYVEVGSDKWVEIVMDYDGVVEVLYWVVEKGFWNGWLDMVNLQVTVDMPDGSKLLIGLKEHQILDKWK